MKKEISIVLVLTLGLATQVAKADFIFGEPTNLGPTVNSSAWDFGTCISPDGLSHYFASNRPGGSGGHDLWVTTRATTDDDWGNPVNLGPTVNSSAWDSCPDISTDGLSLYFCSYRPGGFGTCDLWVVTRATVSDPWGQPVNLGPTVNSWTWDYGPGISADDMCLFFFSARPGGVGLGGENDDDIWVTTRTSTSTPWREPVNLGPTVNSSVRDFAPETSNDGFMLYFTSNRPGGVGNMDLWQVSINPVVDFNGDGIVDSADMCIMVDYWGEDYSLCDIGPMPWGDGVVDVEDMKVLAEHLFENVNDSTLMAHWPLDEAQGEIAYNSVSDLDGTLIGNPAWQPDGGIVSGALQFDGIDDCVSTGPVLIPADGVFSLVAWIQGGAPGQVVISQEGGADWLMADGEGNLISELRSPGRNGSPILSQTNIIDGNWHRIALVWDGSNRILYVDGIAVAEDTQADLEGSEDGLYIGCGKAMETGTFWFGLIDDVRIYNRSVIP